MLDNKQDSGKPEESTVKSIEDGKKAIETEKKLKDESSEQVEKEQEKDAEQWRNEG